MLFIGREKNNVFWKRVETNREYTICSSVKASANIIK